MAPKGGKSEQSPDNTCAKGKASLLSITPPAPPRPVPRPGLPGISGYELLPQQKPFHWHPLVNGFDFRSNGIRAENTDVVPFSALAPVDP